MLLENYIKLLLEAPQTKLGDLLKYPGKILVGKNYQSYWEFSNEEFKTINPQEDLSKRGPFFNCIKLCFDEFLSYENDPTFDVAEQIRAMIIYINSLYDHRNNPDIQGVYNAFIADTYNGFNELKETYEKIYQFIGPKNLNSFSNPSFIELIKSSQTQYLFDTPDRTLNGVLAVVPTTTASSIFWSRTNANAQQVILTKLNRQTYSYPKNPDFLTWCTSFPDDSNMFGSYFERGGTTLFYFLPVDDVEGLNKFCIGVTKITRKDGQFDLICGGHTTVGFENVAFLKDGSDFTSDEIKQKILKRFGNLGLTKEMLDIIQVKVSGRNPFDKNAYIGKIKPAELAAAINMNTIGTTQDGKNSIKTQIETIFKTYEEPEFLKDYQPNPKIIALIHKDIRYWTDCNVNIKYLPEKYSSDRNFWLQFLLTTNYNDEQEIRNKNVSQYFDYLQKVSQQKVTVDFVINFIEDFLNACVVNNLYSKEDPRILQTEFEELYKNRNKYEYNKELKTLDEYYNTTYDNFIIYLKFSDVPTETIMSWSDADILKYFNYQNNIKKTYPKSCFRYKKRNTPTVEKDPFTYFIRSVGNITYATDESKTEGRIKNAKTRNYSKYLLSKLFLDYEDYQSFCKNNLDYVSRISIYNLLKYPLNHYVFINALLYPDEWITDNFAEIDLNQSLSRIILPIKDEDIDEFISDNEKILKIYFPIAVKKMSEEYSSYIEEIEENESLDPLIEKFNADYNILKKYDIILKEINDIEFQNDINEIEKINTFLNGGTKIKGDFIKYLNESAIQFAALKLQSSNYNTIFNFINQFEKRIFEFLISNKKLLVTIDNSAKITNILKESNALELSTCQKFFWDSFNYPELAIQDPKEIAAFLKYYLIDDKNIVFANIKNNMIEIFDNQNDKKRFVNSDLFQKFLDGLQLIIQTKKPKFMRSVLTSYVGVYNPLAMNNSNNMVELITLTFYDSGCKEKRKLLFDAVINVIINELYPEYLSKQVVELFVERFNLENIVIPDYDYFEDDDDDINESIKFKIGNKILTERQLRKLINYLL